MCIWLTREGYENAIKYLHYEEMFNKVNFQI